MSDLINRQDAIDVIEAKEANEFGNYVEYNVAFNDGLRSAVFALEELPSAEPTLYGYKIEHLAFIARVMKRENVPPEKVIEILTDVGRVATIILAEQERIIKQEVETWI